MTEIKTSSWYTEMPEGHVKIGISRGVPRRMSAGYRVYKKLAPGPWFNSVSPEEYDRLYQKEILGTLDPRVIASEMIDLARGNIPVMVCYEPPSGAQWCHRAMAALWLAEALGRPVPELGSEQLGQASHPLMPAELRRPVILTENPDLTPYIGREALIDGQTYRIIGIDPNQEGKVIISVEDRTFPAGIETIRRAFQKPA
jgi:hypothetical protein